MQDPERELFEKWITARYPNQPIMVQRITEQSLDRMRHKFGQTGHQVGDYMCDATQFAWEAWNEALK